MFGLFGTTFGGSCNWLYLNVDEGFAIQENECSYRIDGEDRLSLKFVCDESNGFAYNYNNSDCSGEPQSTTTLSSYYFFDFSCDEEAIGCGSVNLRVNEYDNEECSGSPIEDDYVVYVLIDRISCTEISSTYHTMKASGIGFETSIYTDSDCNDLYATNITIANGKCEADDGTSTEYVFNGTATARSISAVITSVIFGVLILLF